MIELGLTIEEAEALRWYLQGTLATNLLDKSPTRVLLDGILVALVDSLKTLS